MSSSCRCRTCITLDAGTGRVIQLSAGAASVFAADPKVAEVHPASATSLFVFGVAPGRTTIAALERGRRADRAIRCHRQTIPLWRGRGGVGDCARAARRHRACRDAAERSRHHRTGEDRGRRRSRDADRARLSADRADGRQPAVGCRQHSGQSARAHRGDEPQPGPPVGGQLGGAGQYRQNRRVPGADAQRQQSYRRRDRRRHQSAGPGRQLQRADRRTRPGRAGPRPGTAEPDRDQRRGRRASWWAANFPSRSRNRTTR